MSIFSKVGKAFGNAKKKVAEANMSIPSMEDIKAGASNAMDSAKGMVEDSVHQFKDGMEESDCSNNQLGVGEVLDLDGTSTGSEVGVTLETIVVIANDQLIHIMKNNSDMNTPTAIGKAADLNGHQRSMYKASDLAGFKLLSFWIREETGCIIVDAVVTQDERGEL